MSKPYSIRWGIMATGGIARTFTKDLFIDPSTRKTTDILHQVAAVASSSSVDSAKKFVSEIVTPKQKDLPCNAYGSYEELVKDKDVDIVYVATPHSHHFQNCMLALSHNKHILCEKAFTVNAEQAKILYKTAKEKNLFLMEAVWTRYFPLSIFVRSQIQSGAIGEVLRVYADMTVGDPADGFDVSHRMVNKDLAGGCLLDLGIYALTWVFQTVYHTLPASQRKPPTLVTGAMKPEARTGADQMTSMVLSFPRSTPSGADRPIHAIALTSMDIHFDPDGKGTAGPEARIWGTKGEIQVFGPLYRPSHVRVILGRGSNSEVKDHKFDFPGDGHGMFWEADEAARCLRDGKLESETLGWEESTVIMEVMDEMRKQANYILPEAIESTKYPTELPSLSR